MSNANVNNAAPLVIPSLLEWTGEIGTFQLKDSAQIVVDSLFSTELKHTAAALKDDLTTVTGHDAAIIYANSAQAGDLFLTLSTDDGGIGDEGYLLELQPSSSPA
ncbi:hypothetical protein Back11_37720 [Paenibacillus baekrokdamisoli]|uniref:Beta-hexosaminidase bacterial type N-terminal domain-containing protein n=1 Tax=Paenibacillus baekrokdamisoli TaxID=1712516 RepID=A0A3G9IU74_9BACL|nr:glycoside hydrolase family 20 zincin-like fold domain-containing protein [Paenibacillus baekrokdamisoli]MBB3068533.1 hypothetical protein [Paenibacillus baekrokdamisoli]BBH22427.1 hypothetical protein Back11_37720 [Paenibacillus baekrokdamisoli]